MKMISFFLFSSILVLIFVGYIFVRNKQPERGVATQKFTCGEMAGYVFDYPVFDGYTASHESDCKLLLKDKSGSIIFVVTAENKQSTIGAGEINEHGLYYFFADFQTPPFVYFLVKESDLWSPTKTQFFVKVTTLPIHQTEALKKKSHLILQNIQETTRKE